MPQVVVVWGAEAVDLALSVAKRNKESARTILKSTRLYDFASEDEAEAFRYGLVEAGAFVSEQLEFSEITHGLYKTLRGFVDRKY